MSRTVRTYAGLLDTPQKLEAGRIACPQDSGICPERRWAGLITRLTFTAVFSLLRNSGRRLGGGAFYSTATPAVICLSSVRLKRYSGYCIHDRPFYQQLTQFSSTSRVLRMNHPFGAATGAILRTRVAGFLPDPFRLYADRFGPPEAKRLSDDAAEQNIYLLHLLDVFIPDRASTQAALTGKAENVQCFPDAGFVSMHTDLLNGSGDDLAVMARASKFGSDSHRHADQGSFALFSNGKALISPSGYFGRGYGTNHHFKWTKTTKAHNALLIDGEGQPYNSIESRGRIVECRDDGAVKTAVLDLSSAYPMLTIWRRTLRRGSPDRHRRSRLTNS